MKTHFLSFSTKMKTFSLQKYKPLFEKLVVLFLLIALAYYSSHYSSTYTSSSVFESRSPPTSSSDKGSFSLPPTEAPKEKTNPRCNLFKGEWVPNPSGSSYNNITCSFIESPQNCLRNGRPDSGYLYWRWRPSDCELPKFNPHRFIELMRNKSWAFIGDSISRNHVQSFICILSQVEPAKEIYHDSLYKSRTWLFSSSNITVSVIWSPFLVKADIFEDNEGVTTSDPQLHLDKLDEKWTSQFNNFDYVVIAGGKWFLKTAIYYENDTVQGCHYCSGRNNMTELGLDHAYRKVLELLFNFVTSSRHKPTVFFRTMTPDHFEKGEWWSGGTCDRRVPFKEGLVNITDVDRILHEVELQEFEKVVRAWPDEENGLGLKLLNTTGLSLLRPDGHPGPYRQFQPFAKDTNAKVQNDCLHWCLPGPIDSWNDLVMQMIITS